MIGLDTGHLVYNYGTKLQAYAMQTLLERSGDECEIIQWHTRNFGALNNIVEFFKIVKKMYSGYGLRINYWLKVYKRYRCFEQFNQNFHIKKYYGTLEDMQNYVKGYSHVFCGSDQAWLPENVEKHWYTLEYCNKKQIRAAYAPSFGVEKIEDKYKDSYRTFLLKFDYLSVREISGQNIIEELIQKNVPVVLDPTLLLTRKDWDVLLQESNVKILDKEYCFCYFLGTNQSHREAVLQLKKQQGLEIVNLQHFSGYCEADKKFADINLYSVTPQDFIALIANAKYVCTDSFHCTAFSIQYRKPFTVFQRFSDKDKYSTNTRLYSLLNQLELSFRIYENDNNINQETIDYDACEEILNNLRKLSNIYLQEALSAGREKV